MGHILIRLVRVSAVALAIAAMSTGVAEAAGHGGGHGGGHHGGGLAGGHRGGGHRGGHRGGGAVHHAARAHRAAGFHRAAPARHTLRRGGVVGGRGYVAANGLGFRNFRRSLTVNSYAFHRGYSKGGYGLGYGGYGYGNYGPGYEYGNRGYVWIYVPGIGWVPVPRAALNRWIARY